MRTSGAHFVACLVPLVLACATAPLPAPAPPPAPVVVEAPAPPPPPKEEGPPVAKCEQAEGAGEKEGCFPDDSFRAWLCGRGDPTAAVALFKKGTPWVRAYVARNLEAWDPSHRSRAGKSQLALDEEVIVLHPFKPESGVIVVGASNALGWTSVDAVRLDGTCVSLMADEISAKRPPAPKHAVIAWEKLDARTRTALLASPDVRKVADQMTKTCAASADKRCDKAKLQLSHALVTSTD